MSASPRVSVAIVTHDSAADLPACLAAIGALDHRPLELVVVDCASRDESVAVARQHAPGDLPTIVAPLGENRGFAGGMNAALALATGEWVLTLNADALPRPDFVSRLLDVPHAGEGQDGPSASIGAVTGRLVRPACGSERPRLDACGMRLVPTWRHLDRGSGELDSGQLDRRTRVFGATGAASLWRREALDDVAVDGEIFDPRFHSYREDAELCFRLRERGWEVVYEPRAIAEHRRHNLPTRRAQMAAAINRHSLKNRYLLRLYHQTPLNLVTTALPALLRDALALAYVLVKERESLDAYAWLWRNRSDLWQRRKSIQARRTVGALALEGWFWRSALPW